MKLRKIAFMDYNTGAVVIYAKSKKDAYNRLKISYPDLKKDSLYFY